MLRYISIQGLSADTWGVGLVAGIGAPGWGGSQTLRFSRELKCEALWRGDGMLNERAGLLSVFCGGSAGDLFQIDKVLNEHRELFRAHSPVSILTFAKH